MILCRKTAIFARIIHYILNKKEKETPVNEEEIVLTPMMKQFLDLKAKHPDAVMLFRCLIYSLMSFRTESCVGNGSFRFRYRSFDLFSGWFDGSGYCSP